MKLAILIKTIGVLGLIGTGYMLNYQYERIASILAGESELSAISIGKTEVRWDESCKGIKYEEYGRTLEEVLLGALAFHIPKTFPEGFDYSTVKYEWYFKNGFYRLAAQKKADLPPMFEASFIKSDNVEFDPFTPLELPPKWRNLIPRPELDLAISMYLEQAKAENAQHITEHVRFSLTDISSGFIHNFIIRNKKVSAWSFENGICDVERNEPIYRDVARCTCI